MSALINEKSIPRKRRWNGRKVRENLFVLSIVAYPLALFLLMYVAVNINSFVMAFQNTNIEGNTIFVGLENFKKYFQLMATNDNILHISIVNSLKMYFINLLICMPLYIIFAYLLFKRYRGHSIIRGIIMLPQIVSGMVICLLFKKFVDNALPAIMKSLFGMEDFPLLLSDPRYSFGTTLFYMIWVSFSVSLIVYSNAMNEIDDEIFESAKIDGLDNIFAELWYIILPLIFPTLTTFITVGFASFLSDCGPIVTFYGDAAPAEVYNMGYFFTAQILKNNTQTFNMLAAGGIALSLIIAPLTHLLKTLMEKYGPKAEL